MGSMRRSWRSLSIQGGLLAGMSLALFGGAPPAVEAAPICQMEGQCTFYKPLMLFALDYSTAMNQPFAPGETRWQAAVERVTALIDAQNGYLQGNAILGVMRFGHDASPGLPGTKILGDPSQPPIVDGYAIDIPFYDVLSPMKEYVHCNGEAIKAALAEQIPPMNGAPKGIGAWTRGAIARAEETFAQAYADHPQEMQKKRAAALIVLTQGAWTDPSGTLVMKPAAEDPAPAAAGLYAGKQISTYVVAFGDAVGKAAADSLAAAGATEAAIPGDAPQVVFDALMALVEDAKGDVFPPSCTPRMPRIMVLLDASSAMLNVDGGTVAGAQGETSWDAARNVLAGNGSLFDYGIWASKLENLAYIGVAVFGDESPAPGEQEVLVDYGACMKEYVRWALDPATSCEQPGCADPWGGPPIAWTFKKDPKGLDCPGSEKKATSHMPRCDAGGPFPVACSGSGAQLHLGLLKVKENVAAYRAACMQMDAPDLCDAQTPFINILVTDGHDASIDAQVQAPLEEMFAQGVTTYVLAVGEAPDPVRLQNLAGWGSGGLQGYFAGPQALEEFLVGVVEAISFDPCCSFFVCGGIGECSEPDPKCGDGVINGGEQCDDGNNVEGDGCEPDCSWTPVCGDGALQSGEACDDGNAVFGDGCEPDCTLTPEPVDSSGTGGESSSGGGGSSSGGNSSTSGEPEGTTQAPTTGGLDPSGDVGTGVAGSSGESTGPMVFGEDPGCGCAAEGEGARGGLAGLLVLALRRRRRRQRQIDSQTY